MRTNWKIGSDGPMCKACNKLTYIGTIHNNNGTKKGWPVLICFEHNTSLEHYPGRKISAGVGGINTTCLPPEYDRPGGYWYLPKHIPAVVYHGEVAQLSLGVFDWSKADDREIARVLHMGERDYHR